jgi:hypothetical protein
VTLFASNARIDLLTQLATGRKAQLVDQTLSFARASGSPLPSISESPRLERDHGQHQMGGSLTGARVVEPRVGCSCA